MTIDATNLEPTGIRGFSTTGKPEGFKIRDLGDSSGAGALEVFMVDASGNYVAKNKTVEISVTPTITSSSAYAAKNIVGGLLTFANAFGTALSGRIESITLTSKSVQTAGFTVHLFKSNPTNTTWTDKTTPTINAADIPFYRGGYVLANPNSDLGTVTVYTLDASGKFVVASTTSLYVVLETTGTPTFASTTDLTLSIAISQD